MTVPSSWLALDLYEGRFYGAFKPLRSASCRESCSSLRRFYRIILINLRFDNVHRVVPLSGTVSFYLFLSLRLNFHVKLPARGNWELPASFYVLASIIHLTFDCFFLDSPPSRSFPSFIPLKYVLLLPALVPIMTPLSSTPFLCSWKNQSY